MLDEFLFIEIASFAGWKMERFKEVSGLKGVIAGDQPVFMSQRTNGNNFLGLNPNAISVPLLYGLIFGVVRLFW